MINRKTASKLALLSSLYFAQGLPFGFFTQTLPVLLRERGVSLEKIGLGAWLAVPWALKFLWAPLLDRPAPRALQALFPGRRRAFLLPLQLLTVAVLAALALLALAPAGLPPLPPLLIGVFLINLLAATQDIATDGLAVDTLDETERGLGNGVQVAAYRVGMIVGGGLLLMQLSRLGFVGAFLVMAGLLLLSTWPVWALREASHAAAAGARHEAPRGEDYLRVLLSFARRPGARRWLALLLLFKFGEALASAMARPFLVDRGLTRDDIAWLLGIVGFVMGFAGSLLGGALVNRLGRRRALLTFGLLQALVVGGYALLALPLARGLLLPTPDLAWLDPRLRVSYAVVGLCGLEFLGSGLATAALFTAMMDVCRPATAATDYTLQASVVVVATLLASSLSGFIASRIDYLGLFSLAMEVCLMAAVAVLPLGAGWELLRLSVLREGVRRG